MKRKIIPVLTALSTAALIAVSFSLFHACDMQYVSDNPSVRDINNYEANGHYLKLINLPPNTQVSNFSQVTVSNSVSNIAAIDPSIPLHIVNHDESVTAYLPLVYTSGDVFIEDGSLFVTLTVFVDAFSTISISEADKVAVDFSQGRGTLDIQSVIYAKSDAYPHLTINNLPSHIQNTNIANVLVLNQTGAIGECVDYSQIVIEDKGFTASVKIPLAYTGSEKPFAETGIYFVAFDLNIDAVTRIKVTEDDNVYANFSQGSAILDASLIGAKLPVPTLTITGLPRFTQKNHISDVFLYNAAGKTAQCYSYDDIAVSRNTVTATAQIPLAYYSTSNKDLEYFRDSGTFAISFTIIVDYEIQIIKPFDTSYTVSSNDGFCFLDLFYEPGFFSGGLANPDNNAVPVIKNGTSFEMNGFLYDVKEDTAVKTTLFSDTTFAFVYAVKKIVGVGFEISSAVPVFDPVRKGYYSGNDRALFKFVFIRDNANNYFAKSYIEDPFPHLKYHTAASYSTAFNGITSKTPFYTLSGSGNPAAQTVTLAPGVYAVILNGARGGGPTSASRGDGGVVYEIFSVSKNTSFIFYTGQYGVSGSAGEESLIHNWLGEGTSDAGGALVFRPTQMPSNVPRWSYAYGGTGGAGGGSGTFAYCADGYFLCAGGGGGAGGNKTIDGTINEFNALGNNGKGGAGGSIGGGGAGTSGSSVTAIYYKQNGTTGQGQSTQPKFDPFTFSVNGGSGGNGGGNGYGIASAGNASLALPVANAYVTNGYNTGSSTGMAAYLNNNAPSWLRTNSANGTAVAAGQNAASVNNGGNNRNSTRGGNASNGSITVYKIASF